MLSGSKSLNDFKFEKQQKYIKVYDISLERYVYNGEAFNCTMKKWNHIARMTS
jgi:hypothetical protein